MNSQAFHLASRIPRQLCLVALLSALSVMGCATNGEEVIERPDYEPIREAIPLPREPASHFGIEDFVGEPLVDAPLAPYDKPENPFLDAAGSARVHNDSYNTGSYRRSGVLGPNVEVLSTHIDEVGSIGVCATLVFDKRGFVFGSCIVNANEVRLVMLDPETMDLLAVQSLGPRPFLATSAAGGYFSFDSEQRIIIGTARQQIERWAIEEVDGQPQFVQDGVRDLTDYLGDADILPGDTVVDWQGRVWFMTNTGIVGYLSFDDDTIVTVDMAEELHNSMAVDETGVYFATFEALYKVQVDEAGEIDVAWRKPYEKGSDSSGGLTVATGTTPTIFGSRNDLITICDNADEQIHMLVWDTTTGDEVCKIPLFQPGNSATENSATAYVNDLVIANSAGFAGPFTPARDMSTGMERWTVREDRSGCDLVWRNEDMEADSSQLAINTGVLYGYGTDRSIEDEDVFNLYAIDWDTGEEIFRAYVGNGVPFDTITGQPHVHPDGGRIFLSGSNGIAQIYDVDESSP